MAKASAEVLREWALTTASGGDRPPMTTKSRLVGAADAGTGSIVITKRNNHNHNNSNSSSNNNSGSSSSNNSSNNNNEENSDDDNDDDDNNDDDDDECVHQPMEWMGPSRDSVSCFDTRPSAENRYRCESP
jgi:hypothetical protein